MTKDNAELIIQRAEEIWQRFHDLDYEVDPKAQEIDYSCGNERNSLAFYLGKALADYDIGRGMDFPLAKEHAAKNLIDWFNAAVSRTVIRAGSGLIRKVGELEKELQESRERCTYLESEIQELSAEYLDLQGRKNDVEEKLRLMFKSKQEDLE